VQYREDRNHLRAKVGTSKAFEYRDRYFDEGVPIADLPLDE
jgi:hypothetical protein